MNEFIIEKNSFLSKDILAFYNTDFFGSKDYSNNPNYLYKIKNDPHHNWSEQEIEQATKELKQVLKADIRKIWDKLSIDLDELTICVVPRAKTETTYNKNQLMFKFSVKEVIRDLCLYNFIDGTNYIERHTDTKTTHLNHKNVNSRQITAEQIQLIFDKIKNAGSRLSAKEQSNNVSKQATEEHSNNGSEPYRVIILATCRFSENIRGKNILLIDDIYTKTVNIDEDMIQALLDCGANKVYFYAVAKTLYKGLNHNDKAGIILNLPSRKTLYKGRKLNEIYRKCN